ncbi:MAG TPA: carboxypeptidase-like regulatory domain-containing protein [Bryobacteraceae bacterium]|nr:carboxypeptidase-like regulatory domain-containing protein [Bryobacteraceae bacterium]
MKRLLAVIAILLPCAVFGQEFRGTISGVVTDPTGAGIPGARVITTEVRTGTKTQTVSESTGQYTLPFLAPGQYQINASMQGFKEYIRKDINLGAGEHPVIDVRMEVGDTSTAVEVAADVPLLNTDNATTGQAITTKEVEDIPLNGGTPYMVAQFALGVVATGTPTLVHPFDLGAPAAFSVSGTPAQTSELLMNGVPNATWDGRAAYNPPRDAVQEVRVNAFDADSSFGHTGGGTINQVMKSGTNGLHGSAWEYNQPSDMVANDFFRNRAGQGLQITHFNQFGVTAGGPVVLPKLNGRNKLFWFFAYEGLKDGQPSPALLTVPTDAERAGNFAGLATMYDPSTAVLNGTTVTRTPLPNNVIPQSQLSPIALAYMKFYPEPNVTVGLSATGVNNYSSNATTIDNYNNEMGRLDYNISDRNRLFFDVRKSAETQNKNNYFQNPAEGSLLFRNPLGSTVDDVYTINPSTVADVRLNFTRLAETHALPSTGFNPTSLGFPAYVAADSPYLQMPGISLSTFQSLAGSGASNYPSQSLQLFGKLTKIKGNHTISFGADARQYRVNTIVDGNSTGTFSFNNSWVRASSSASSTVSQGQDLASFLLGLPTSGSYDLNSYASFYSYYAAGFIQDDWRVSRTFTINAGLHYDHDGAYHEKWGRTVDGFDFTAQNPIAQQAIAAYQKNPIPQIPANQFNVPGGLNFASPGNNAIYQNTSHLVSPRVGFAWSPEKLHNTVIRGGFGMFVSPVTIASMAFTGAYSTNPILAQEGYSQTTQMTVTNNNYVSPVATLANPYPNGLVAPAGSAAGLATFLGQTVNFLNPEMKNPYSLRWNLDIQHTFGKDTLLEVAYIGNHSVHLPITVTQLNGIPRQYLSTSPVRDTATNSTLTGTVANPFQGLLPNSSNQNGATTALANLLSPYPAFPVGDSSSGWTGSGGILEQDLDLGRSYFHSLNVRVSRRLSHGLSIIGNFGYTKLIQQDSWLNDSDPVPEKRVSPYDHPLRFVTAITYDLPVGRGQALNIHSNWLNAIVGGWHINSTYTYQMGAPIVFGNGSTTTPGDYVYYGGAGALAASLNNRQVNTTTAGVAIPVFDTSLFATNSANAFAYHLRTFSTTFPNIRQDGLNEWDPSLLKRFSLGAEGKRYLQFRFEFFNILNHPTFSAPNVQATNAAFGTITSVANRPRTIQVGARMVF